MGRETTDHGRRARRKSRSAGSASAWLWLACALCAVASEIAAQTAVYHSPGDTGANPGQPLQLPVGPWQPLYLWLNAGTTGQTGDRCISGSGRELCGYEVKLTTLGGASFVDFLPAPGVVHRLTPNEFRANGVFALNSALGPVRIGQLKVASSEPGSQVKLQSGVVVLSGLRSESIPQSVMATTPVPEPGRGTMLLSGVLLLVVLTRRRAPSFARRAALRR